MRKILIAGASGFIGRALIDSLLRDNEVQIVGLSREDRDSHHSRLIWKKCDLFSLKDITLAMEGCDTGYYLVHSMLPSAALSQGTFYDFDLIMADNFIRAARRNNLEHVIYLGGMIPLEDNLSWHLRSRLEVEESLRTSGVKTTVLRAGLVIGPNGSSFTILQRLIERLPIMICPAWTKTYSQPVALQDIIKVLVKCLTEPTVAGKIFDVGGPEILTYQDLISKTAAKSSKRRQLLTLNIIPLPISRLWVSFITGVPKNLVYPLVLSLKHEMVVSPGQAWPFESDVNTPLDVALEAALVHQSPGVRRSRRREKDVRSIQRMVLPPGRNAAWVADEYFRWLPTFFSSLIKVRLDENCCTFFLFHPSLKLLVLEKSQERSSPDRQLLYIVGGMLAGRQVRGRLEFREVLDRRFVMAAIHEFRPALPWFIYKWSQALIHVFVMIAFGEHLRWHFLSQKKVLV